MILAAVYMLAMVNGLLFGPARVPVNKGPTRSRADLNWRELSILSPLAVLVVVLGVCPTGLLVLRPTQRADRQDPHPHATPSPTTTRYATRTVPPSRQSRSRRRLSETANEWHE